MYQDLHANFILRTAEIRRLKLWTLIEHRSLNSSVIICFTVLPHLRTVQPRKRWITLWKIKRTESLQNSGSLGGMQGVDTYSVLSRQKTHRRWTSWGNPCRLDSQRSFQIVNAWCLSSRPSWLVGIRRYIKELSTWMDTGGVWPFFCCKMREKGNRMGKETFADETRDCLSILNHLTFPALPRKEKNIYNGHHLRLQFAVEQM